MAGSPTGNNSMMGSAGTGASGFQAPSPMGIPNPQMGTQFDGSAGPLSNMGFNQKYSGSPMNSSLSQILQRRPMAPQGNPMMTQPIQAMPLTDLPPGANMTQPIQAMPYNPRMLGRR